MNILVFDTSGEKLVAGLFRDRQCVAVFEREDFYRQSEQLVPALQDLIIAAKIKPAAIDVIVVGLGPGSFTGIRVGVVTAKILSYSLGCKLVGVSSFEAIAAEKPAGRVVLGVDARRGNVYGAVYEKLSGGGLKPILKPSLLTQQEFFAQAGVSHLSAETVSAEGLLAAAWPRIEKKKFDDAFKLEPLYLYKKDCSVTRQKDAGPSAKKN